MKFFKKSALSLFFAMLCVISLGMEGKPIQDLVPSDEDDKKTGDDVREKISELSKILQQNPSKARSGWLRELHTQFIIDADKGMPLIMQALMNEEAMYIDAKVKDLANLAVLSKFNNNIGLSKDKSKDELVLEKLSRVLNDFAPSKMSQSPLVQSGYYTMKTIENNAHIILGDSDAEIEALKKDLASEKAKTKKLKAELKELKK